MAKHKSKDDIIFYSIALCLGSRDLRIYRWGWLVACSKKTNLLGTSN